MGPEVIDSHYHGSASTVEDARLKSLRFNFGFQIVERFI
jgi:hypothetical protein